jgi:hypothetical protein
MSNDDSLHRAALHVARNADNSVRFDSSAVAQCRPSELLIRFAFGFTVSVVAGLVSLGAGDRAGGMFLAFPAILPATLTLIERKDGEAPAEGNAAGAMLGAVAMCAFAIVSWALLDVVPSVVAELLALAVWTVAAVSLFLLARRLVTGRRASGSAVEPQVSVELGQLDQTAHHRLG